MKTLKTLMMFLAMTVLTCGPKVTTQKMGTTDLSNYNTFAYLPNSNFDAIEKFKNYNTAGMSVIKSINENMKAQGYTMDRDNPDLLVLLTTNSDIEKTVSKEPVYATYPNYYNRGYVVSPYYQNYYYNNYYNYVELIGYDTDINRCKEGMLMLRLVDSKNKKVVWKGRASYLIFQ